MISKESYNKFISKKEVGLLFSILDISAVIFFVLSTFIFIEAPIVFIIDLMFLMYFILDYSGKMYFSENKKETFFDKYNLIDLIIILTFIPIGLNLIFLRSIRLFRVVKVYHAFRHHKIYSKDLIRNEEVIKSIINLFVFIMISTGIIYVFQVDANPQINNYLDALYFTVSTISTTGYGDITPTGDFGFFLTIIIMILGITLFFKFANDVVKSDKVFYKCKSCGLLKHEPDAIRCKHCGKPLKIKNEGIN